MHRNSNLDADQYFYADIGRLRFGERGSAYPDASRYIVQPGPGFHANANSYADIVANCAAPNDFDRRTHSGASANNFDHSRQANADTNRYSVIYTDFHSHTDSNPHADTNPHAHANLYTNHLAYHYAELHADPNADRHANHHAQHNAERHTDAHPHAHTDRYGRSIHHQPKRQSHTRRSVHYVGLYRHIHSRHQ